ncbi:hypothetical protein [Kribbella sp. NPDC023855]|uniref:hypothetical protein n=1 Tax=Kribbella sp. NPDC023855 TaxID=3154698 RepID=UPI00340D84D8
MSTSPTSTAAASPGPPWLQSALTIAIVAAVAGILGAWITANATKSGADASLAGSRYGAESAQKTTQLQLAADQAKETRNQRAQVYAKYLTIVSKYYTGARLMREYAGTKRGVPGCENGETPICKQSLETMVQTEIAFLDSRVAYQAQIDQLTVYGSEEAMKAHQVLAAMLPPTLGPAPSQIELGTLSLPGATDPKKFAAAYGAFQKVFCREAAAQPRSSC